MPHHQAPDARGHRCGDRHHRHFQGRAGAGRPPPKDIPPGVAAALARLETAYAGPLTPPGLAKVANLSSARLARNIKRIFAVTPIQLIAKTRIAASRLLRETRRSISEIVVECGFYDHIAFTRALVGVTPTQFRSDYKSSK